MNFWYLHRSRPTVGTFGLGDLDLFWIGVLVL